MKAIHLIQNRHEIALMPKPKTKGAKEWTSGYWAVSPEQAAELENSNAEIYFHEKQTAPAFFGGRIEAYRVENGGEWKGRIVFTFIPDQSFKGKLAGRGRWATLVKIVE